MKTYKDLPMHIFPTVDSWEKWLEKNHDTAKGIWIQIYKKNSGKISISHAEALDVALCYGWIDSLANKYDDETYLQKFGPRRPKSLWSKVNTEHIERLIKESKMKPAGLKEVEAAKKDGRWHKAYNSPSNAVIPEDFLQELKKNKKALAFFETLNKTNLYAISWRLETAKKPETRKKRMRVILEMLEKGEKFH